MLNKLFNSKSIAIIPIDKEPFNTYYLLENLKKSFPGEIYPINPDISEILGIKCYPSLEDIEEPIELAIVDGELETLREKLDACVKKKIKACLIISDIIKSDKEKQEFLKLRKSFEKKIDILGPGSIGIYKKELNLVYYPDKRLTRPSDGAISIIDQSKTIGPVLFDQMARQGIGISKYISTGISNMVPILNSLGKDIETRCIVMYINDIENGLDFIKTASRVVHKKPIIVLTSERATQKSQIYSEAFKKSGIIETDNIEELFDYSKMLEKQPLLKNNKIAVMSNSRSIGKIAHYNLLDSKLEHSELSKEIRRKADVSDDIIWVDPDKDKFEKHINVVLKSETVDSLVCILSVYSASINDYIDVIIDAKVHGKPISAIISENSFSLEFIKKLQRFGIPVYPIPQRAIKSLEILWEYGKLNK